MATTFSDKAARRIVEATRLVEARPRNTIPTPQGTRTVPYQRLAITTGTITARGAKVPGFGNVQPYLYKRDENVLAIDGPPLKLLNWTGSTVDPNVWVKYTVIDGCLWLDGNDCSGAPP